MDWSFVHSKESVALVCCGTEGAEPKGKIHDFLIHLRSITTGYEMWIMTKRTRSWKKWSEINYFCWFCIPLTQYLAKEVKSSLLRHSHTYNT